MAGTDGHQYSFRLGFIAPGGFKVRNGTAQGKGTLVGGIVGPVILQCRHGCQLDGLGGIEIRLTDGEHGAVFRFPGQIGVDPDGAALQGG